MAIISTTIIDNAISRVRNGMEFVHLLSSLGHSHQNIETSIKNYLNTPTLIGEWEKIIIDQAKTTIRKITQ